MVPAGSRSSHEEWAFIVGSSFMFVGSAGDAGIKVRDKVHGPKGQEGGEGVDG